MASSSGDLQQAIKSNTFSEEPNGFWGLLNGLQKTQKNIYTITVFSKSALKYLNNKHKDENKDQRSVEVGDIECCAKTTNQSVAPNNRSQKHSGQFWAEVSYKARKKMNFSHKKYLLVNMSFHLIAPSKKQKTFPICLTFLQGVKSLFQLFTNYLAILPKFAKSFFYHVLKNIFS